MVEAIIATGWGQCPGTSGVHAHVARRALVHGARWPSAFAVAVGVQAEHPLQVGRVGGDREVAGIAAGGRSGTPQQPAADTAFQFPSVLPLRIKESPGPGKVIAMRPRRPAHES